MTATMTTSHLKKYHQAAYAYILMGAAYMAVFYSVMPPHDFKVPFKTIIPAVGLPLMGLSWFIYKGYKKFTIVLFGIYAVRIVASTGALVTSDDYVAVPYILPILIFTFFMLGRAVWDWKP